MHLCRAPPAAAAAGAGCPGSLTGGSASRRRPPRRRPAAMAQQGSRGGVESEGLPAGRRLQRTTGSDIAQANDQTAIQRALMSVARMAVERTAPALTKVSTLSPTTTAPPLQGGGRGSRRAGRRRVPVGMGGPGPAQHAKFASLTASPSCHPRCQPTASPSRPPQAPAKLLQPLLHSGAHLPGTGISMEAPASTLACFQGPSTSSCEEGSDGGGSRST